MSWRYDWLNDQLTEVLVRRRSMPLVGDWFESHVVHRDGQWRYLVTGEDVEYGLHLDLESARRREARRRRRMMNWARVEYVEPEMRVALAIARYRSGA